MRVFYSEFFKRVSGADKWHQSDDKRHGNRSGFWGDFK